MLPTFVNCTMVLKNASISSFFDCQRRNKDQSTLVNCGGVEFLKLRWVQLVLGILKRKKNLIQVLNEYSLQLSELYNWQLKNKEAFNTLKGS
jgi:hypothetical protein